MNLTKPQLKSLAHGMPGKKRSRVKRWQANHEMWRKCSNCGAYEDLRKTDTCGDCGTKL